LTRWPCTLKNAEAGTGQFLPLAVAAISTLNRLLRFVISHSKVHGANVGSVN
jgi:hypothetical protein